jgi:hypothetical protein
MNLTTPALSAIGLLVLCTPSSAKTSIPPPDPIAYSCYFCTDEEMEQVAIDQGEGQHYVYDANRNPTFYGSDGIFGYVVRIETGIATAARFEPEPWLKQQYSSIMRASWSNPALAPIHTISNVTLLAPDSHHGRSATSPYLWGHHTSALNPLHPRARETLRRWIAENVDLPYLRADTEHGRVLQFAFQTGGRNPTLLRLYMPHNGLGHIDFYLDRANRRWEYLGARNGVGIEESAGDFVGPTGLRQFEYSSTNNHEKVMAAFLERAQWAGVTVIGQFSARLWNYVDCEEKAGVPVCTIKHTK